MKKFIVSDLHIGHPLAQYDVMDEAVKYILENAQAGDSIWGLGDWFHLNEMGLNLCMKHPITAKLRDLAIRIPTRLIPGNHDNKLGMYFDNPDQVNPISPIEIIKPFWRDGFYYCHGHEYDPAVKYIGSWLPSFWDRFTHTKTPGNLKADRLTGEFLMAVSLVHSIALLELPEQAQKDNQECRGIVLGHTHLPLLQQAPELPLLVNDGDMRHSSSFAVLDDGGFHLMRWDRKLKKWQESSGLKP
ncbi:MAG: metallophosphoesterase family protein [Dehalococcoidia bacterium]